MGFIYNSKILSDKECEFIKGYILKNESKVKSLGDDEYAFTKNDSLTGRYKIFNWLYTDIGDLLIPKLKMIFSQLNLKYPIAIQCWVNTFRKGEGIKKHMHLPYPGYKDEKLTSGHIFISGPEDIGTWYEDEKMDNGVGELTLFTSDIFHYVPENTTDEVRITIAIDIAEETIRQKSNRYYIMEK